MYHDLVIRVDDAARDKIDAELGDDAAQARLAAVRRDAVGMADIDVG